VLQNVWSEALGLALLYGSGLRLIEALALRVHDLDFSATRARWC